MVHVGRDLWQSNLIFAIDALPTLDVREVTVDTRVLLRVQQLQQAFRIAELLQDVQRLAALALVVRHLVVPLVEEERQVVVEHAEDSLHLVDRLLLLEIFEVGPVLVVLLLYLLLFRGEIVFTH